jgi:hypothetical protein
VAIPSGWKSFGNGIVAGNGAAAATVSATADTINASFRKRDMMPPEIPVSPCL